MFSQFFLIFVLNFPRSLFGNINKYYDYYETLHHNSFKHHIVRRDLYSENPTHRLLEFDSHGRHFKLVLHKSTSLVAEDFKLTFVNENGTHAMRFDPGIYHGYIEDEPTTSSVTAYWDDSANELTATISTDSDVLTIEPSWRFLPASDNYNLVSYKSSDLKQNKATEPGTCGVPANNVKKDDNSRSSRNRRNSASSSVNLPRKTCQVRLVADFKFFETVGNSDKSKTAKYLLGLIAWVDKLFRDNSFDRCGKGFGFEVKNITVHETPTYGKNLPRNGKIIPHYNDAQAQWNLSEDLLEAFTFSDDLVDNSQYCLVHLFTAVGFKTNVFGVAFFASLRNKTNGMCSAEKKTTAGTGATNTGWTTFVDRDNKRLPARQAYLVTAHEFGHGWGSHHDPKSCAPRDIDGGKYIMFISAVNGLQKNNDLFSSCSKVSICDVLQSRSQLCFKDKSTCGNFVLDDDEECDEGPASIALNKPCCTENCRFKHGYNCSDWNHKCCEKCQYANTKKVCHEKGADPCTEATNCSGSSKDCPTAKTSDDDSSCSTVDGAQGRCANRTCVALCEAHNLTSCLCDAVNASCQVCCRNATEGGNCTEFYNGPINVPNNTPCPIGVCVNGTCEKITGVTVVRPGNFINFESLGAFVIFMKNNIVGSVIIISLFLWIPASCGVSYIDRKRARELRDEDAHFDIMSQLVASSVNSLTKIKVTTGTIERKGINRSREAL